MTAKEAADAVWTGCGRQRAGTRRRTPGRLSQGSLEWCGFLEPGAYRMMYGVARMSKNGSGISGDNYTYSGSLPGQVIMSLSDGMGSGAAAAQESRKVIELLQQLLETGFSARSALKMVNTILLLTGAGTASGHAGSVLCGPLQRCAGGHEDGSGGNLCAQQRAGRDTGRWQSAGRCALPGRAGAPVTQTLG